MSIKKLHRCNAPVMYCNTKLLFELSTVSNKGSLKSFPIELIDSETEAKELEETRNDFRIF